MPNSTPSLVGRFLPLLRRGLRLGLLLRLLVLPTGGDHVHLAHEFVSVGELKMHECKSLNVCVGHMIEHGDIVRITQVVHG